MSGFCYLTRDTEDDGRLTVVEEHLEGYDYTLLWEGRKVPPPPKSAILVASGKECDLVPNSRSWVIMSQRFVDLIASKASEDLQLFPAPLVSALTSERIPGYYIVNCVRRVPCLDREHSIFKMDDEINELVVYKLIVDGSLVPATVQVFRVDETPYQGLVFRETLVRDLVGRELRGVVFIRC